jgi:hypothetical protein
MYTNSNLILGFQNKVKYKIDMCVNHGTIATLHVKWIVSVTIDANSEKLNYFL